jgi:CRISPR-associated protein Csm3
MAEQQSSNIRFEAHILLRGQIKALTGLHIGGSKDKMEIGGVDSPVIRNPQNQYPYIPGSSIKGKLRSLLEFSLGVVPDSGEISTDPRIARLFGLSADDNKVVKGPSRVVVRDCYPDQATLDLWQEVESELLYTEYKGENFINRITSMANPRFVERVVPNSCFKLEILYGVYRFDEKDNNETINADLNHLLEGLRLLEHSALGKSGSRGYGQVEIHLDAPLIIRAEDYRSNGENYKRAKQAPTKLNLLSEIGPIVYPTPKA